jgi:hypothetical protein
MVIDLTLNNGRLRKFKMTDNEDEFERGRNILITNEMKFNNRIHVENTLKYFFNMTKKYFNEETKNNVYIHDGYFYDGNEREDEYKEAIKRYMDIDFENLRQELFYINFDAEDITEVDFKEAVMSIEDYYREISKRYRINFKNITYVFHFNQDFPHVHVIYEIVR